jgi:uncharacterized protein (TIGR02118 family)
MLLEARVHPARLAEFRRWYAEEHVPRVLAIPGIVEHRALRWGPSPRRDAPNVMSLFLFESAEVIQQALGSREARRARRDWERWAADVRDLTVQVYANLDARTIARHLN